MSDKYREQMDGLAGFGFLINAMESGRRGRFGGADDGDRGHSFPRSDAEDLSRGARFIPGEVTMARRDGQRVTFVSACGPCCWYWNMPDGSRIYHFDRAEYEGIAAANGRNVETEGAGPCHRCGNPTTGGGKVPA